MGGHSCVHPRGPAGQTGARNCGSAQFCAFAAETAELFASVRYDVVDGGTTGMGVVDFTQTLTVGGLTGLFHCRVTIVWRRAGDRWVEARLHASLLDTELPDGFGQPAA